MADAKLEREVTEENSFLVSMLGLMSGTVEIDGEKHDLKADWTGGTYIKVNVDGYDEKAVFDLNEMIDEAVALILDAHEAHYEEPEVDEGG